MAGVHQTHWKLTVEVDAGLLPKQAGGVGWEGGTLIYQSTHTQASSVETLNNSASCKSRCGEQQGSQQCTTEDETTIKWVLNISLNQALEGLG